MRNAYEKFLIETMEHINGVRKGDAHLYGFDSKSFRVVITKEDVKKQAGVKRLRLASLRAMHKWLENNTPYTVTISEEEFTLTLLIPPILDTGKKMFTMREIIERVKYIKESKK